MVLVYKIDRFFRDVRQLLETLEQLAQSGVGFVSATEPFETTTPVGRFLLTNLASVAELERSMISERCEGGKMKAAQAGKWMGGKPPYGFRADPATKQLVIYEEAEVVRMVHRWLVEERLSVYQIQQRLNTLKVPTQFDAAGKPKRQNRVGWWVSGQVYRLLTKSVYQGYYTWRGIRIPCPRIVPEDLWEAGRRQLEKNRANARRRTRRIYLLKGLIRCSLCGRLYVGKTLRGGYTYYSCASSSRREAPEKCGSRTLKARGIEPLIWETVVNFLQNPDLIVRQFEEQQGEAMADTLRQELEYVEAGLARLREQEKRLYDGFVGASLTWITLRRPRRKSTQNG